MLLRCFHGVRRQQIAVLSLGWLAFALCLLWVVPALPGMASGGKMNIDPNTGMKLKPGQHPGGEGERILGYKPPVITDPTSQIVLGPGLEVTLHTYEGLDNQWRHIGDYDFVAKVQETGPAGFIYDWHMSNPANAAGIRRVEGEDVRNSRRVSLFYPRSETCTLVGYTNAIRISDVLYRELKEGKRSEFSIDGPETVMVLHHESVALPHYIQAQGEETINIRVEGVDTPVRTIKAVCDNGWTYWVLDNPRVPMLVQGNAPFRWVASLTHAYGDGDAIKEAKRIINDLRNGGVATSYLILFDFDSDRLRPHSKEILNGLAEYLHDDKSVNLQVEGHCCTIGGYEYNMGLSRRRAASVKKYLVQTSGIAASRLRPVGFGYTRPEMPNDTEAHRARNRRVIFRKF
ncbi:MAG: OmpA family protein [Cyanobacteria bacterium SZAS TMP-1]|nr:OmpA family protein [Cyanobacteria bacterium SZAS TMP-1]